jgi:hypothetical protein
MTLVQLSPTSCERLIQGYAKDKRWKFVEALHEESKPADPKSPYELRDELLFSKGPDCTERL